uniref:Uncharacterized protein n=1 Tax=Rhizophora mucronata TaxID=61149 RepID=A0A2P2P9E4_RHIMU
MIRSTLAGLTRLFVEHKQTDSLTHQ